MTVMDKERAISVASNFLRHIYDDNITTTARIMCAEADDDTDTLCNMLDTVIDFCAELKKSLKQ